MWEVSARAWYAIGVLVVIAVGVLYVGAATEGGLGFPLDDGWIHQTYARNLARTGRLAYDASGVSTGSTSPLWTALLGLGYVIGVSPFAWTLSAWLA